MARVADRFGRRVERADVQYLAVMLQVLGEAGSAERGLTIRRYTAADHPALLLFLAATWAELGRQFLPDGKEADLVNIERVYLDGRGAFYVAEFQTHIIGSAALRYFSEGVAELKRVYVAGAHRRMGLAERLCTLAIADAQALRYRSVRLDTTKESTAAVALFRKLGFKDIPRYHDEPFADVFMEKTLSRKDTRAQ